MDNFDLKKYLAEAFYVYMPFDEEIMKEMKSKFPVIKIGGKTGKYYEVVIEKK